MAWRRPSDKPLSEPMMVSLPTLGLNELIASFYPSDSSYLCVYPGAPKQHMENNK